VDILISLEIKMNTTTLTSVLCKRVTQSMNDVCETSNTKETDTGIAFNWDPLDAYTKNLTILSRHPAINKDDLLTKVEILNVVFVLDCGVTTALEECLKNGNTDALPLILHNLKIAIDREASESKIDDDESIQFAESVFHDINKIIQNDTETGCRGSE
jgi:hypothetical protein